MRQVTGRPRRDTGSLSKVLETDTGHNDRKTERFETGQEEI
jgi:hypothetical protein